MCHLKAILCTSVLLIGVFTSASGEGHNVYERNSYYYRASEGNLYYSSVDPGDRQIPYHDTVQTAIELVLFRGIQYSDCAEMSGVLVCIETQRDRASSWGMTDHRTRSETVEDVLRDIRKRLRRIEVLLERVENSLN